MTHSRGDRTFVTLLLALVLIVAGMMVADAWRRSQATRAARPEPQPATAVESTDVPEETTTPARASQQTSRSQSSGAVALDD